MISETLAQPSAGYMSEFGRVRRHNSRALSWSVTAHLAVIVLMMLSQTFSDEPAPLVEISWLEPEKLASAAAAAMPVVAPEKPKKEEQTIAPSETTQKFERELVRAEIEPEPQRPDAVDDQLSSKLEALQSNLRSSRPNLAVTQNKSELQRRPSMATAPSKAPSGLVRDDAPKTAAPPRELSRSTSTSKPRLAVAPTKKLTERAPTIATPDEDSARRTLDGAQLVGPVADRPVLSHKLPVYPQWATREAVEASVTLYFIVLANGRVKDNILVQKTSGHADFDKNAQEALRAWRFEELSGAGEQWGTITFNFKLTDG